jgi:hypothetical protein
MQEPRDERGALRGPRDEISFENLNKIQLIPIVRALFLKRGKTNYFFWRAREIEKTVKRAQNNENSLTFIYLMR